MRYGSKPLEFSKGKNAIEHGSEATAIKKGKAAWTTTLQRLNTEKVVTKFVAIFPFL